MSDAQKIANLKAALVEANAFIGAPMKMVRIKGEVFDSTYRQSSSEYNRLTAKMRKAIQEA